MPWYRVRPSYQKPSGGFLAVGPRYQGEPVENDPTRVLFRHHGMPEWTEIVAMEDVEEAPEEPKRRNRWK
jgi:hypothetical protein